jgi:hypothetical protein
MEIQLKAKITNGRLVIESVDEKSSMALSEWLDENRHLLNRRLDIEVLAHSHLQNSR